ncbi:hypothetical protein IAT38_002873 [Cryptococcus sp. DSM 104549]
MSTNINNEVPPPYLPGDHQDPDPDRKDEKLDDSPPEFDGGDTDSIDDEGRELPEGWLRLFDDKQGHHFYVEESTKRTIWHHPYDDKTYLYSLPITHAAHPDSKMAQAYRQLGEDEQARAEKKEAKKQGGKGADVGSTGGEGKKEEQMSWLGRKKAILVGTKEEKERARAQEERKMNEEFLKGQAQRAIWAKEREEIWKKHIPDDATRVKYTGYAPPDIAFSRGEGMYGSPYGYGYGRSYGRRGMGYGQQRKSNKAMQAAGINSDATMLGASMMPSGSGGF